MPRIFINQTLPYRYHYIAGFDTLRFLAFLAIFFYHNQWWDFGYFGVDFFFTLSAFLLTFLAFREKRETGNFSKKHFFIRRALRIYPLYFLLLIFSFYLLPYFTDIQLPSALWKYWLFLSNYSYEDVFYPLRFLWSISAEEQFYLLFLLSSSFFLRHFRYFLLVLGMLYVVYCVGAYVYRWPFYTSLPAQFPLFAGGMWLGYYYEQRQTFPVMHILWFLMTGVILFAIMQGAVKEQEVKNFIAKVVATCVFMSVIVAVLWVEKRQEWRNILIITDRPGIYTYGLYVYSGYVIAGVNVFFENPWEFLPVLVKLLLTLGIAGLSYHFYERYFLRWKPYR